MARLVYGVGINDVQGMSKTKTYELWRGVIERCYSESLKLKYPTYKDCTCDEDWIYFSNFLNSLCDIDNFGHEYWVLDKDLLQKRNKHYGIDTCCFIPEELNLLLIKSDSIRGDYPVGVHFDKLKKKFVSQLNVFGKRKKLGYFDNQYDAFSKYKMEKEKQIKILADKYKDNLSSKSYNALLSYSVEITD